MESSERSHAWWIIATIAIGLYGALAVLIRVAPDNVIDQFVFDGVSRWEVRPDLGIVDAMERLP